jgi:hypothetical protein
LLNAGQQKVSPRHLLEVMGAHLRAMFHSWGLPMVTQREHVENPGRRTKRAADSERPVEGVTHFRYEFLLDALGAYLSRNPHMKTSVLLQQSVDPAKLSVEDKSIDERITEIGDEVCKSDLLWVCRDLNQAMQDGYKGDPNWQYAILTSDNFTFPLLAALGTARDFEPARPALEDRKAKLIQILSTGAGDPLALVGDGDDRLAGIQSRINSNIGRRRRAIVYGAFRYYFRRGTEDASYPIDWHRASLD